LEIDLTAFEAIRRLCWLFGGAYFGWSDIEFGFEGMYYFRQIFVVGDFDAVEALQSNRHFVSLFLAFMM
jgi:hypothetical protein